MTLPKEIMDRLDALCRSNAGWFYDNLRAAITTHIAKMEGDRNEIAIERDESDGVREKLAALLTGVANALRGDPPELVVWDWSDLPKRAKDLRAAAMALDEASRVYFEYWSAEHEDENCPQDDTCGCPMVRALSKAQRDMNAVLDGKVESS